MSTMTDAQSSPKNVKANPYLTRPVPEKPPTLSEATTPLTHLATILSDQVGLYDRVETMIEQKRQVLVKGNAYELANIDQKLMVLAQDVERLEKQRQALLKEMGFEGYTLKEVIDRLSSPEAQTLRPLREQLKKAVERVQVTNQHTQGLLQMSINWVADTVNMIAKAIAPEITAYNPEGQQPSKADPRNDVMSSTIEREA